jgi:hypothetical protein
VAAEVNWADWTSGTTGANGLAPPPIPGPSTWARVTLGLAGAATAARRQRG